MNLAALADFNAVAVHGGFGPASRAVDRPKASLSRHVADLEDSLGVRLIERGSRRLRLTEEGAALHARTKVLMAEIDEAGEAVASHAPVPRGRLRVSAPIVFAHVMLCRAGARFAAAYPQVALEIVAEDRMVDPVEDGYDLVIRVNPAQDDRLIGRRIWNDERWAVSVPALALPTATVMPDQHDTAHRVQPEAPLPVPAIVLAAEAARTSWEMRSTAGDLVTLQPIPVMQLSSLLMVRNVVLDGAGVALLPKMLIEEDVQAGRVHVWGVEARPPVEIWALYHSRRLLSAKVRAFLDMLPQSNTGAQTA
jgi:DNA-binding transcriptional LysR family regulator